MLCVASSNAHLREECCFEFIRRYTKKKFILRLNKITPEFCDETDSKVIVYGLKFILHFFRIFGDLIQNITICLLDDCAVKASYVIEYLCHFCSRSLKKICFQSLFMDIFGFFNRFLINIKEIVFVSCILSENFKHFNLFFPNVKNMDFNGWNTVCSEFYRDLVEGCDLLQFIEKLGIIVRCDN